MKHYLPYLPLILALSVAPGCTPRPQPTDKPRLYVTIHPLRSIVQQIVGDDFPVEVLVPAGASPESFEPTPRQYAALNDAVLVFNTGLIDFEQNLLRNMENHHKLIDLSRGIPRLAGSCAHTDERVTATPSATDGNLADGHSHAEHRHGIDPHIWTSPRALKQMAANAFEAIRATWPDSVRYAANFVRLNTRLDSLDKACSAALAASGVRTIVIYHPALTYYAADYGLEQLAIENEGKEPSARHLAQLIEEARSRGVRQLFYQAQYPASTVEIIAEDIGARSVRIDPLREDVIENIGEITRQLTSTK